MKLLLDQNISFRVLRDISDVFHGSEQVARLGLSGSDDVELWQYAKANGFVLVTQDADFAEMALLRGPPPKVVWLRCGNRPTAFVVDLIRRHAGAVAAFAEDPETGCLEIYA